MTTISSETRLERLQNLRRVVLSAPDDRWDMSRFSAERTCGTIHCAAGWFAVDEWARANTEIEEIFKVVALPNGECRLIDQHCDPVDGEGKPAPHEDDFVTSGTFFMLARLFGITLTEADYLFAGEDPYADEISKADVIDRIDRLIAGQPIEPYHCDED